MDTRRAVFLIPYVIVTFTVAGVALMKFGSDLLTNKTVETGLLYQPDSARR